MSSESQPPSSDRLPQFDPDALDPTRRAIADRIMAGRGRLPSPFRVWLESPMLAEHMHGLGQFLASGLSLTKPEAELVILAAAAHIHAEYVLAVHSNEARRAGLDEDVIAAITAGDLPSPDDTRLRALATLTRAALDEQSAPPDDVFEGAVAALTPAGVAEAMALLGYFTAVGAVMKLYAVEPPVVKPS